MRRLALVVIALVVLGAGCRSLTGRTVGQWVDDRTITARVKARLAETNVLTLTRVHVDTYDHTVYLTGGVDTLEMKHRAEQVAGEVPQVQVVVNNLHVLKVAPAASPPGEGATSSVPRVLRATGLARIDPESGTPAWTRYAGFDANGRRIATIFALPTADVTASGVRDLPVDVPADRLSIHPDGATSYVVMWQGEGDSVAGQ